MSIVDLTLVCEDDWNHATYVIVAEVNLSAELYVSDGQKGGYRWCKALNEVRRIHEASIVLFRNYLIRSCCNLINL